MRSYVNTANYHAPFQSAYFLSGLGSVDRKYYSTAYFRAPYQNGYFQDNSLMGIIASEMPGNLALPGDTTAYLRGGKEPEPSSLHDAAVVVRQIPSWLFVAAGVGLSILAYRRHKQGK